MANQDISFVNPLYSVVNEKESTTANILFFTIVLMVLLLVGWANIAEIDELTSGEGKVIPSSKIQKVQYYDGGIVSDILIKEGDHVLKNDDLMFIDKTRFKASFEETQESLSALESKQIRLKKELTLNYTGKLPKLKFPKELEAKNPKLISNQKAIFKNKFYEIRNTLKVFELQDKQKRVELKEIQAKVAQLKEAVKLTKEEFNTIQRLVKSGTKSKIDLITIKQTYNTQKGDLKASTLAIERSKLSIQETTTLKKEKLQMIKSEVYQTLQETITEINVINSRLISDNDKLEKTTIKSPVNGTIKQINVNTIGSVIQSGMDILEIVPDSDILYIEAKIDPKDIAFINPNLTAIVKLTAYDFSIYGGLEASILEISADSIKDEDSKDGKSYYKLVVKTNKNYLEYNGEKLKIIPGMVASVDIVTGKKTIMDFILKPILKVKAGSFHER